VGTLSPGKLADFVAVPVEPRAASDLEEYLLTDRVWPTRVYLSGLPAWE